jgi:hypothetical protein
MQKQRSFNSAVFLGIPKSQMENNMLVFNNTLLNNHVLQPYSKHEITQQTLFYIHIVVVHVGSSVISWLAGKIFYRTTHTR